MRPTDAVEPRRAKQQQEVEDVHYKCLLAKKYQEGLSRAKERQRKRDCRKKEQCNSLPNTDTDRSIAVKIYLADRQPHSYKCAGEHECTTAEKTHSPQPTNAIAALERKPAPKPRTEQHVGTERENRKERSALVADVRRQQRWQMLVPRDAMYQRRCHRDGNSHNQNSPTEAFLPGEQHRKDNQQEQARTNQLQNVHLHSCSPC